MTDWIDELILEVAEGHSGFWGEIGRNATAELWSKLPGKIEDVVRELNGKLPAGVGRVAIDGSRADRLVLSRRDGSRLDIESSGDVIEFETVNARQGAEAEGPERKDRYLAAYKLSGKTPYTDS